MAYLKVLFDSFVSEGTLGIWLEAQENVKFIICVCFIFLPFAELAAWGEELLRLIYC